MAIAASGWTGATCSPWARRSDQARRLYLGALLTVAPEADLGTVTAGADVRRACGLDPRAYQRFVDEAVPFLVNESARVRLLGLESVG